MLSTRILTALVALAVVLGALFLLPLRAFALVVLAIMAGAAHEWTHLARFTQPARVAFVILVVAAGAALVFWPSMGFARGWPEPVVVTVCGAATLFWVLVATPWVVLRWPARSPVALGVCGFLVLMGAFVALVELEARSPWLVLAAMAIVWIADTAAYFSGRSFGRRKLAPQVSPGKTWEGVYGALVAVSVYALAIVPLARSAGYGGSLGPGTIAVWLAFAVAVAALSVVGDLFESWQKRQAGVKDSGKLLPGHGGVLDRIDALLAAMPALALGAVLALHKT
jgi:phosphatidate cytidylyltransferase